jgi:alkanesulfonate monooxygenase SsuD/methylene tetrahydromethanopterin reductase-like flavin-dependent oxidoreductase (luciferase family)
VQICRAMFRCELPSFEGRHFHTEDAINSPAPVRAGGPPIMIGGQGERRTARLVAQYADMWNCNSGFDEIPRKLDALAAHCQTVGREPATINKTPLGSLMLAPTMEAAVAKRDALLAARGFSWDSLGPELQAQLGARFVVGDPDSVAEQVHKLLDLGLDGVVFNMPADGWDLEAVALAGEVLAKAVV